MSGKITTKDLNVTGTATGTFYTLPSVLSVTSLTAGSVNVTGTLDVNGKSTLAAVSAGSTTVGALTAASAQVATSVSAASATLTGALTADSASVTGKVTAATLAGDVEAGALTATGATTLKALTAASATVTGASVLGSNVNDVSGAPVLTVNGVTQFQGLVKNTKGYRAQGSVETNSLLVNFGATSKSRVMVEAAAALCY